MVYSGDDRIGTNGPSSKSTASDIFLRLVVECNVAVSTSGFRKSGMGAVLDSLSVLLNETPCGKLLCRAGDGLAKRGESPRPWCFDIEFIEFE